MPNRVSQAQLDKILPLVEKPARYTGGEYNSIVKENAEVSFALCFPDIYEIGMSHLGSRIIYSALNSREDTVCERVYAPWADMEAQMRQHNIPMFTLETKRHLKDFDIIGFSLSYELCYTNILMMLDLSGIPFFAKERGDDMPLIICGGASVCNIEPVAEFFDCVLYGEGEEMIHEFIDKYRSAKQKGLSKREILLALKDIKGVYIPSFYKAEYENGRFVKLTKLEESAPDKIQRRVVVDLDKVSFDDNPIVPNISIVHDRVPVELFRGCTRGCRFCQAGFIYRPVRERQVDTLINQAEKMLKSTGYDEVSLFSLSSGDYSKIHELVPVLAEKLKGRQVSISLPSLRIDSYLKDSLEEIASRKKTGLTFAPEAGTQRLRDVINKGVTEEDLLNSAREAFLAGWSSIKLYFMIGLPTETDEDILGIADLVRKVIKAFHDIPKEQRAGSVQISVSASVFVPKPHTPFQWSAQDTKDEIVRKQTLLRNEFRTIRGATFSYHEPDTSILEAVFARGDRRLASVVACAYMKGAKFDSWHEHFKLNVWEQCFLECGIDTNAIAHREYSLDEKLPWEHLDSGVTDNYLKREYERAQKGITTKDCRKGCQGCFDLTFEAYENCCKA